MENTAKNRIGFGKRLAAYLLDVIVSWLLAATVIFIVGITPESSMGEGGVFGSFLGNILSYGMYINACYLPILCMDAFMGQSPGKVVLGIQIANSDGTKASIGVLAGRATVKYLQSICSIIFWFSGLLLFATLKSITAPIIILGCLLALGKGKQALHDMILNTAVFEKSDIQPFGPEDLYQ